MKQRFGGNYNIDANDIMVAEKAQCLRQLVKHDVTKKTDDKPISQCSCCVQELCKNNVDYVKSFQITA